MISKSVRTMRTVRAGQATKPIRKRSPQRESAKLQPSHKGLGSLKKPRRPAPSIRVLQRDAARFQGKL